MASLNILSQIDHYTKNLVNPNHMLGRMTLQPFRPANSGSRALMSSIQNEQHMALNNPEVPYVGTGYETYVGENSSSYIAAKSDYKVLFKIDKFEFTNIISYIIVQNLNTGVYDVIERTPYNHNTESYGFIWDSSFLDQLKEGDIIAKGTKIKTSIGFDSVGNKMNGCNLVTAYMATAQTMEDSIQLSVSGAKKLGTSLIRTTDVTINDNDILLNLYGDDSVYKTFPDIGEQTSGGMFCSIRRFENDNVLYSLSQSRLRESMMSDRNILINGLVVDIDVFCNNPEILKESHYNQQLYYYHNQRVNFCNKIIESVGPLAMTGELSYNLQVLYSTCRDSVGGKAYFNNKLFSNVNMRITVIQNLPMEAGDKMCDRYGGKGVVSAIVPDELMPVLDNGTRVDVIKNQSTCINRENIGQLHEQSLTFIGMRLIDAFKSGQYSYTEMARMVYKYMSLIDNNLANELLSWLDFYEDEASCKEYIDSIIEDGGINISDEPFTTNICLDTIEKMYDEFGDLIKPYDVFVPMEDSNGNIRMIKAKRPMVIGKIYNYRLKQYAEEKFSVTSLSATNLKGLNTRSKANKIYETKYTKTPIKFGPMESGNMAHIGMQYVVMNLMLYSSSPQARRLFEQLLIGDPYNIDIKLDKNSKNRNAEIINALLKTMGLKLVFEKVPKVKKQMVTRVMVKDVPLKGYKYKTNIRDIIGHDGELEMQYNMALRDTARREHPKWMVTKVMCRVVDKNGKEETDKPSEKSE